MIELRPLLNGIATWVPGLGRRRTGGSDSARYCYSVWMRHWVRATAAGLRWPVDTVAELGPGDSVGTGLAALLCGARRYLGFDLVAHADLTQNLGVLEELIELFARRAAIPGPDEFPEVKPPLRSYAFPAVLEGILGEVLAAERLAQLRRALEHPTAPESAVQYRAPWMGESETASVDFIWSQAVLEHIDDLDGAYQAMARWLKPGGFISHQIDFRSHGTSRRWNGHWSYGDATWRLIRGGRSYLLNREPRATHQRLLAAHGFEIADEVATRLPSEIPPSALARRFRGMSADDFETSGWFVIARNPP